MAAIEISTFNDLLLDLAEKVGETSLNNEDARKRKINSAYKFIANKQPWWWLEATSSDTTTTALSYTLPTLFRMFHPRNPVKINTSWYTLIPFSQMQLHDGASSIVTLPFVRSRKYAYIYGSSIFFVQDSMTAAQTITYYYYKRITSLDATSDEPLMPTEFREMISLYAAGMHLIAQGGPDAVEGERYIEMFDIYMKDMEQEDDNRRKFGILRRALDPEEATIYNS